MRFYHAKPLIGRSKIIEEIFVEIEKDAVGGGHAFQDIQGDVYEMLLGAIASAGKTDSLEHLATL
jgi:type I restriction enzyme M protein